MSKHVHFCCPAKQYFITHNAVIDSLEITPRIIIWRKNLKVTECYEQLLVIKNKSMFARHLLYHTDSPEDMELKLYNDMCSTYIEPNQIVHCKVTLTPRNSKGINRRRHVFIEAQHPNAIFEIPILVVRGKSEPSMPAIVQFSRSVPKTFTYYDFTLYNPSAESILVAVKTTSPALKITLSSNHILKGDYVQVMLALNVKSLVHFTEVIKVKFGTNPYLSITCEHKPIHSLLHVNVSHLRFEEQKFEREAKKEFNVCNESQIPVTYNVKFLTETSELDEQHTAEQDRESIAEVEIEHLQSETSYISVADVEDTKNQAQEIFDINAYKHFHVNTQGGQLRPNSSNSFTVIFRPVMDKNDHFDNNLTPPYLVKTKIIIICTDELNSQTCNVIVTGLIRGPEIEISPTIMDLRLYLGEEHCEFISVLNIDGQVDAHVFLKDYTNKIAATVAVTPVEGITLASCTRGVFRMSFYTRISGKFTVRLKFKVVNGDTYIVTVKGISLQMHLRCFPDIVELGSVPVAVPQKRSVLLMNPLSVPITVQCITPEDGVEVPLVLNVRSVDEIPPLTVKDPIKQLEEHDDQSSDEFCVPKVVTALDAKNSQLSFQSISDDTSCSTRFEEEVLGPIPHYANTMVYTIKRKRTFEKSEVECRVLTEAVNDLLSINYFKSLTENMNYAVMDWNALPNEPKEIYCDSEIIYLSPNTGKNITVLIVPNILGYHNRAVEMRVCPIIENEECLEDDPRTLVASDLMTTKLWIEYNCRVPDIVWTNEISFKDLAIYAGQAYDFDFEFDNQSNIGGFVYFDVVPDSTHGVMRFKDNLWKFYIPPDSNMYIYCDVVFKSIGKVQLPGIVKFVGNTLGMSFRLTADVLPTEVHVTPSTVSRRQEVLETSKSYVYIDNVSPTITWVTIYLSSTRNQHIYPEGMVLSPTGQGMYVTLYAKYCDPGLYHNTLYIDLQFEKILEIPITFNIEGMPIFFDPEINEDLKVGVILMNSEQNFHDDIPNFYKNIRVWNCGERVYRLTIHKLKNGPTKCSSSDIKARLQVTPKSILLQPGGEDQIQIAANGCEEAEIYNEFRIQIVDYVNPKRFMHIRFVASAKFVSPVINWNRREICMNYYRTHKFKEHVQLELVQLINLSDVMIEMVNLRVVGPFKIKTLFEERFCKELNLAIAGLERKELTILLNKVAFKDKTCTAITNGRIICTANGKPQKSLRLTVHIFNPVLSIAKPQVMLFTKYKAKDITVEIENRGCLDAQYKWKKLDEEMHYIREFDNSWDLAHELLSDIMRMLDLTGEESEVDSIYERNMTLRYQKYRCKLQKLQDPIGVVDILNDIIESLDLEHKRYALHLDENIPRGIWDDSSQHSTKSYVEHTMQHILGNLKLEDSYEISPVSSDDCLPQYSMYFYDKSGILAEKQKAQCLLHLPPVRKGYAATGTFLLEVVGGTTQRFQITAVNLERTITISNNNIYLGVRPWYELFKVNTRIFSVTQFPVNIRLEKLTKTLRTERLTHGYLKIVNERRFDIPECGSHLLRTEGIMGFSEEFRQNIKVVINDGDGMHISVRGQGVMPILTATGKLERIEQEPAEIQEDYKLLQRIYYFQTFKAITQIDKELGMLEEEEEEEEEESESKALSTPSSLSSDISVDTDSTPGSSSSMSSSAREERAERFFRLMQTYVLVNNNRELPNAQLLEQLIETEKFLKRVKQNADTQLLLQLVYQDYVKLLKTYDEKMPINLKNFMAQPLPCQLHGHILSMGGVQLHKLRKFEIVLHFFGPGKLIVSARTVIKIPGLAVVFHVVKSKDQKNSQKDINFLHYMSEDKSPDFFDKRYRNMYERVMDEETDVKLKHAHSFDMDSCDRHRRDVTAKDRKNVLNYYNSLNKSVYMEHKHHYTLCKIFANSKENFSDTKLRVVVLFKPEAKFYEEDQLLEDYLYIDLHLGPTLPILMRGMINKQE